jgi:hypothetical protein
MLGPAWLVRSTDDLQTAVFLCRTIDGDVVAGEMGKEDSVLIPVAVVLMPGPRATNLRVLHNPLRVIVIRLVSEELRRSAHDGFGASDHPVDCPL